MQINKQNNETSISMTQLDQTKLSHNKISPKAKLHMGDVQTQTNLMKQKISELENQSIGRGSRKQMVNQGWRSNRRADLESEEEEEGFAKKEDLVFQVISSFINKNQTSKEISVQAQNQQLLKSKYRNLFKKALTIYKTPNLYTTPPQIFTIPSQLPPKRQQSPQQSPPPRSHLLLNIATTSDSIPKLTDFAQNKRLQCVYNRHNENLSTKNDMTIYIRNIRNTVQSDMIYSFQSNHIGMFQGEGFGAGRNGRAGGMDAWLEFQSSFQCGNLYCVFRESNTNNFYLFLQNDVNTHGYNQWFNFWVRARHEPKTHQGSPSPSNKFTKTPSKQSNHSKIIHSFSQPQPVYYSSQNQNLHPQPHSLQPYTFTAKFFIVNISKDIRYHSDMRIMTHCKGKWEYNTPFTYYGNKYERYNGMSYMTIQFQYEFVIGDSDDKKGYGEPVHFSLTYPYSYTKLIQMLKQVKNIQSNKWQILVDSIGKSQCNNHLYLLKLLKKQNPQKSDQPPSQKHKKQKQKQCILVISRQHPGQPVSSFICEALIKQIIASPLTQQQENFDWLIVPMANPDGVVHGNSRTNMKGYDINRCWMKNMVFLSSEVESIDNYIMEIRKQYKIGYIFDLHGHSKNYGSFLYFTQNSDKNKAINYLLSQRCQIFEYYKSKFGIGYKKRPTLRGQMHYREQIKDSITIQTSLYGYMKKNEKGQTYMIPFGEKHFMDIAESLHFVLNKCQNMYNVKDKQGQNGESSKLVMSKVCQMEKKRIYQKQANDKLSNSVDSDSNPEDQYLQKIQRIKIGIETVEQPKQQIQKNQLNNNSRYNLQPPSPSQTQQKAGTRAALLSRYTALQKKNKQLKSKRKPIYTNSNVEFLSSDKLNNSFKKYSLDQSNQILSRKTIEQIQEVQQKRNKRIMSSSLRDTRYKNSLNRVQPIVEYPTSSNIKIDAIRAAQIQEDILYMHTKLWNLSQRRTITDYRFKRSKSHMKSMLIKPSTSADSNKHHSPYDKPPQKQKDEQTIKMKIQHNKQRKQLLKNTLTYLQESNKQLKTHRSRKQKKQIKLSVVSKSYRSQHSI